jgi:hypothetical protein
LSFLKSLPIIVLTPIKNEEWIIDKFLSVTSLFADVIIVADQFSTDRSREIAARYPKVDLILNERQEYNEEYRQKILLDRARSTITGRKLLIALDADEIITADSLMSPDWEAIELLPAGTELLFEKPDLLPKCESCIRYKDFFSLGYIDDLSHHIGSIIHSKRLPGGDKAGRVNISSIKFMHFAKTRSHEYLARQRYYSMIENISNLNHFYTRLNKYSSRINDHMIAEYISKVPASWIDFPELPKLELKEVQTSYLNNYNTSVLDMFKIYGFKRFFNDDIWNVEWQKIALKMNKEIIIVRPPWFRRLFLNMIIEVLRLNISLKKL